MKAKDFMKQLQMLNKMIENKMEEKKQLQAMACSITAQMSGERVQTSGSKDKLGNAVTSYVDIEAEIDHFIDKLYDSRKKVISIIEKLDNPIEYDLLHKMYVGKIELKGSDTENDAIFEIHYMDLYEVAALYNKSYTWATTTHGRALKNVQQLLDEREEE